MVKHYGIAGYWGNAGGSVLRYYQIAMQLFTIGHSTHSFEEFLELLQKNKIDLLIDVRTIPKSRRVPWFNQEQLAKALNKENISYQHMPELGGLRHAQKNSINVGWRNASFRGYADYMQTENFRNALDKLNALLKKHKVAIMCAEAVPWRCHRSLIADAELIRGIDVQHILSKDNTKPHELTDFAKVDKKIDPPQLYYPPKQEDLF